MGLGKERRVMKAKDKVQDAAENLKPYVERAMEDEKLRDDVMRAFKSAREIYQDLMGEKSKITLASRVATDDDIRDKLRDAIEDLRNASERLQGKKEHPGRNTTLLVAGLALGLLFNPITGPETRRFIKEMLNSDSETDHAAGASNGRTH
jgi:gas vesicle protein